MKLRLRKINNLSDEYDQNPDLARRYVLNGEWNRGGFHNNSFNPCTHMSLIKRYIISWLFRLTSQIT